MNTPAGWYRDLDNPDLERYWDGTRWTERTQSVQGNAGSLHPSEHYNYDTTTYSAVNAEGDRTTYSTERVGSYDADRTTRPVERTPGATPVGERRGFNPVWLLLPLLLLLGLWLLWNAMDDDTTDTPTTTTTTSTTTSATDTGTATATDTGTAGTATDTGVATDTATASASSS